MTAGNAQSDLTNHTGNSTSRAAVEALFRHRRVFVATVGLVLLATAIITVFTPRTYESEMNILVRNARPEYLITAERSNGQILPSEVTEERINSEMEVLKSRDVADVVVDPEWGQTPLRQRSEAQIAAHEKAVIAFAKHLTVESLRKSNVIRVAYVTSSPRAATDTVERLLKAFLAKQHEIERSSGASTFFETEAARYKAQLDQAQQDLAGYQQNNQIVSLGAKETTLESQITALEDAIRATDVQITEAANRVASDKHELALLPSRMSTQQRSVPNTQAVEQLTAILTNYQNKRTELLTRYQPTERLIAEVDQQIATTSAALANARATNGQESTTDVNPVYQQVKSVLTSSTTDLAALRGRLSDLTAQHARLRQQLVDVEGSTVDYSTLQARVAELQSNYQLYSQKKNEAQISDAMDQQQLVNVAVAERPTFSGKAYRPQVLVNAGLGLLTALFLGLCAVFYAELGRETVSAAYDLEAISRVPVLATVPMVAETFPSYTTGRRGPSGPGRRRGPGGSGAPPHPAPSGGTADAAGVPRDLAPPTTDQPSKQPIDPGPVAATTPNLEDAMMDVKTTDATILNTASRLNRSRLMTFEQLSTGQTTATPKHPISPFAESMVAEAVPVATVEAPVIVEPVPVAAIAAVEPVMVTAPDVRIEPVDPGCRIPNRLAGEGAIPVRSRLSPSQRAQLRRNATPPAREGRLAYVTYTIDPRK